MKPIFGPELRLWLSVALALCGFTPTQAEELPLKPGMTFKDCATDCPEMVVIPAGSFAMGSTADESGHKPTEEPEHKVTIAKPFAVSKFAVTFAEWDACAAHSDCSQVDDHGWGTQSPTGDQRELGRREALRGMALQDHRQNLPLA
jgi:formylglycine-generating enzyme required for sulfatase activity